MANKLCLPRVLQKIPWLVATIGTEHHSLAGGEESLGLTHAHVHAHACTAALDPTTYIHRVGTCFPLNVLIYFHTRVPTNPQLHSMLPGGPSLETPIHSHRPLPHSLSALELSLLLGVLTQMQPEC